MGQKLIIKNILNKIEINKYTYIIILIGLMSGLIKEISSISILLITHEFGHFITSKLFKWKIKKIIFYPFGGMIIFDDSIDKPLLEEFIITLMGPLFQLITCYVFYILNQKYIITNYYFELIKNYNFGILIFNILPIVPLDGSKILNILFNKFLSFRKSYIFSIYTSVIILLIFILKIKNDPSYYILIMFLTYQIILNIKNKNYIFNKFILEKKLYNNNYKKYKKIKSIKNMYRNKKHLIYINNMYVTEKHYLKTGFN